MAVPVGETIKLFACWPSLERNIKLLDGTALGPERLAHIIDRLEGGRSAIVDRDRPLMLKSGCLHAVVTLRGGFMYAGNFLTRGDGPAFLRSLRLSPAMVGRYDEDARKGLVQNIVDQLDLTLECTLERPSYWLPMIRELILSWPDLENLVTSSRERKVLAGCFDKLRQDPLFQETLAQCSDLDTTTLRSFVYGKKGRTRRN